MHAIKTIAAVSGFTLVSLGVVVGTFMLSNRYLTNSAHASEPAISRCQSKGVSHTVTIQNNAAIPKHTVGKLCDTMTIINNDDKNLLMAFGVHDHHQPYDGVTEQELRIGQSMTVTFNQAGTYLFHDHLSDIVHGDFTVTN